jgi:uncharacterized membrane protein YphA (DoxX/SURF4 family)
MAASSTFAIGRAGESDQRIPEAPWSTAHKVAFRFAFCYFVQYIVFSVPYLLLTRLTTLQWNGKQIIELPWLTIVPWVSSHILRFTVMGIGGTYDSAYYWVQKFCYMLIAAIVTIVWSILDSKRADYAKLDAWLRLFLRLCLAYILFGYGGAKVMPFQMPPPSISRMVQPFGDLMPFHLLWAFMGYSTFYEVLCGVVEMVCSVLLLIPGMTMLGAFLSLAALGNILVLNVSYDVFVKLIPLHLALFAFYLLTPYIPRIMNLFVFNQPTKPERPMPLFHRRSLNYLLWGVQWAIGIYLAVSILLLGAKSARAFHEKATTIPLYGVWDVDEFAADGQVRPPLLTDNFRWQRIVVDSEYRLVGKKIMAFQEMNGQWFPYLASVNAQNNSISLKMMAPKEIMETTEWLTSPMATASLPDWDANISLNYTRPQPGELILQGLVNGHQLRVTLKRDDRPFLLETHKKLLVHESFFD